MIEGVKNIVSLAYQDFINLIHINPKKTGTAQVVEYSKKLQKDGIIKIESFIAPLLADELREEIEALSVKHPRSVELKNGTKFNYRNQDNPDAADAGMLDIFYIENVVPKVAEIDQGRLIQTIQNVTGQEVIPLRTNAYLNHGIKNTRGYHIDNAQPVIYKAFLYLTDVSDTSFGPYSFVKKTHRFSKHTYVSLVQNLFSGKKGNTDMGSYPQQNVIHGIGAKGDLILSSQNGIHRGLPQAEGKKRVVLIFNYMVKSKLSYIHRSARENIAKIK